MLSFPRFRVVYLQQALQQGVTADSWVGRCERPPSPMNYSCFLWAHPNLQEPTRCSDSAAHRKSSTSSFRANVNRPASSHHYCCCRWQSEKFLGTFTQPVLSVSAGGRFPGKKKKELTECQRFLWGKQMVLLSNEIHQSPGDVKSASGYTGNKMSRTETHGVSELMQHFLSVGRKCCRKTPACVSVL